MGGRAREYRSGETIQGTVYLVHRLIGAGGMGTVYDVEDTSIGKRYVLKTLHAQLGSREDLARRMQVEARTLARLNHTNIVEIFTAGVTGDDLRLPYYVMERLNGQSLALILQKRGRLDLAHAYHIAIDLLDALAFAHEAGVIHRDVKPDNIFLHRTLSNTTVTKLLDFGIISFLDKAVEKSETAGRFLGTLRYAAPEQLRGDKPTAKVDVYAAALVLYEMLAGHGPFDSEGDHHKIAEAHSKREAPRLSSQLIVPPELDSLMAACLHKNPALRPRDAFSFAASLRNLNKALGNKQAPERHESLQHNPTGPAITGISAGAAPFVRMQGATPEGPYVVAPSPPGAPPSIVPAFPGRDTTEKGMHALSQGPSLASPGDVVRTATSAQSVDRLAPTHTHAPATPPMPGHGTGVLSPLGEAPTLPSDAPSPASMSPFQWPPEPPPAPSGEAHVRTLPGAGEGAPRSTALVIAAVLLMVALAIVSVALFVVRLKAPPGAMPSSAAGSRASGVAPAHASPPPPAPVVTMPAPTIGLPALDEPASTASAVPTASVPEPPGSKGAPGHVPVAAPASASSPAFRPGPGF
ncbi:MAG TPA: protein kinase [Polyangiaceae bacterium]|jgi:serine/threonine-protein kinase